MALPKLQVQITADTKQAEDGMKKVSGEIGSVENASRKAMSAVKAFAAGLVSIAAVGTVFSRSVNEAQKFETTMFRIQAIIKATGGAAGRTAQDLRSFAQNLALNTLESTEGVLEAQQRLLTFRKVSGDVFDRTIAVAADLSAVLGQNMSGAAIQLGRALEDPVSGLSALARTGTVFTEQQKEMVKRMVASGQQLEAQKFILSELEAQYGGAAVAAAQGYAGALDTLGQKLQEFFLSVDENLGLTKALSAVYLMAADAIQFLTDNMARLVTYIGTAMAASVAYAAFMARGWVAAFVSARFATLNLAGSLAFLRAAMIRTGILALIVGAGELVYQFTKLVDAAGSFGQAMGLLADVAVEVWGRIKDAVMTLPLAMQAASDGMELAFLKSLERMLRRFQDFVNEVVGGLNSTFNMQLPYMNIGAISGSGTGSLSRAVTQAEHDAVGSRDALSDAFGNLTAPLESVQKIKDLLASIKDEKITLPDLLGVAMDAGGEGGKGGKSPLEEDVDRQVASLQLLKDQGRETWMALGTFLQQFAGKSKAAAIAVIAINKGLAIAQAIQNTAVAVTKALSLDPTGVLAARVAAMGKLQIGLIAATGLAQAMGGGGGSGGGGGGSTGAGASSAAAAPATPTQTVSINLQGDTFSRGSVEGLLEQIQSQLDRGGRLVFS